MDWEKYGYVISGLYRSKIVSVLRVKPSTLTQIASELELPLSNVSSTLKDLIKMGIVKNLTPNLRKGKLFALTELGTEISFMLKRINIPDVY